MKHRPPTVTVEIEETGVAGVDVEYEPGDKALALALLGRVLSTVPAVDEAVKSEGATT